MELLEQVRDALQILKLCDEVALSIDLRNRAIHLAEAYLDELLPPKKEKEP